MEVPKQFCACGSPDKRVRHGLCRKCYRAAGEDVLADLAQGRAKEQRQGDRARYAAALDQLARYEAERDILRSLAGSVETVKIEPRLKSAAKSEGTVVLVASDWHMEELVGAEVGGLNRHSPEIAKVRATRFFQAGLRLTTLLQQDIAIDQMILPLLGDFITGQIHGAENAEKNAMPPAEAVVFAQNMIASGIEHLLAHSKLTITCVCHSGNHGRTSHTTRFGSENGHSLEYLMYLHLAAYFRHEPRVQFMVAEGMHSYVRVYDQTIRFHHGHAVKYGGGVGGIYIPVNKAVSQWNKGRHADLDVFGHFHQMRDGGNFLCNGSNIGYNSFALSIKADYEQPRQTLFLMDKKRGRTCTWPVLVEEPR